jgi:hypothetical protein
MQGKAFKIQNKQEQWIVVTRFLSNVNGVFGGDWVGFSLRPCHSSKFSSLSPTLFSREKKLFVPCGWLMPVILATQETEIRRITVWSQPGETQSQKKPMRKKVWWGGSMCRPWVQTPVPQKKKKKLFVQEFFEKLLGQKRLDPFPNYHKGSWQTLLHPKRD